MKDNKINENDVIIQVVKLHDSFDLIVNDVFIEKINTLGITKEHFKNASVKFTEDNIFLEQSESKTLTVKLSKWKKSVLLDEKAQLLQKGQVFYFFDGKNCKRFPLVSNCSYFEKDNIERFILTTPTIYMDSLPTFFVDKDGLPITMKWGLKDRLLKRRLLVSNSRDLHTEINTDYKNVMLGKHQWLKEKFFTLLIWTLLIGIVFTVIGYGIGGGF